MSFNHNDIGSATSKSIIKMEKDSDEYFLLKILNPENLIYNVDIFYVIKCITIRYNYFPFWELHRYH